MFAEERHNAIRKIVREHRRLSFAELQEKIQASPATLRRDLTELEKSGDILRVHGGVLDPRYVRSEISFDERLLRNRTAKKSIAETAAALIPPGVSVFVDAGSTCLEAGKMLLRRKDVRVISHSVALLSLSLHGEAEFLCIGGELRRVSGALIGAEAIGALSHLRADYAFLGASGLDAEGCFTTEVTEAEMKKAILARSNHHILLADISKWNTASTVQFTGWQEIHEWITNAEPDRPETLALRKLGVRLRKA